MISGSNATSQVSSAPKILVIDDDLNFLLGISRVLTKAGFDVTSAGDGRSGIAQVQNERPDLLLLDVNMPNMNGFQVKQALNNNPRTQSIPTVFLSAMSDRTYALTGLSLAEDYINKPFDPDILVARLKIILHRLDGGSTVSAVDAKNIYPYERFQQWGQEVEIHDTGTAGHTRRVALWALALARSLGVSGSDLDTIWKGAMLHDIGKLAVPDYILNKVGPLTEAEWATIREHPTAAVEMLKGLPHLLMALDIPHYHHERWDGTGYPKGLKGDRIPLAARIFSVVDVYDALCTQRPYRPALDEAMVLAMICAESGRHFDPRIADHFYAHFSDIKTEVKHDEIAHDFSDR
jgi:putative two-component system response regulator